MAIPSSSVNSQVATSGGHVQLDTGDILNMAMVQYIKRQGTQIMIRMVDGSGFPLSYQSAADADTALLNLRMAVNPITIGTPFITTIKPFTAAAGSTVNAVLKGQGFKSTGTVKVGADVCTVTFIDSFTLLLQFLGTAPASFVNVVYTDPDLLTTATLTSGFQWT